MLSSDRTHIPFRRLITITGYPIYINMEHIQRVWYDEEKHSAAIMYQNGMVDHVKETIAEVLLGK